MKTWQKIISFFSLIASFMLLFASATPVRADWDKDDEPNYLLTTRIVNRCNAAENPTGPQVPAPNVATGNANCPTVHPNNNWSIDIGWFDPVFQKYYLADRDNKAIDIVDTKTDKVVGQATGFVGVVAGTNTSGPNGVVTTHNPNQLWGGDGNGDTRVYSLDAHGLNPTLLKVIPHTDPQLNVTHRADELAYDPDHKLILMAWDDDSDLLIAFFSVDSNASGINVVGTINLKAARGPCPLGGCSTGGIEQPAYDRRIGRFLISIPASVDHPNGEVLVINPVTKLVEKAWDTTGTAPAAGVACNPNGLAIGPYHQALLGCTGFITLIIDDRGSGPGGSNVKVIKTITQVGGSDEVWFNPGDNNYYTASSNFTTPVLGIIEAGNSHEGPEWIQNVVTGPGSHSVAAVYGFGCDRDRDERDRDHREGRHHHGCDHDKDDIVNNRVYVPLRINQAGNGEVGGIGIVRRP